MHHLHPPNHSRTLSPSPTTLHTHSLHPFMLPLCSHHFPPPSFTLHTLLTPPSHSKRPLLHHLHPPTTLESCPFHIPPCTHILWIHSSFPYETALNPLVPSLFPLTSHPKTMKTCPLAPYALHPSPHPHTLLPHKQRSTIQDKHSHALPPSIRSFW